MIPLITKVGNANSFSDCRRGDDCAETGFGAFVGRARKLAAILRKKGPPAGRPCLASHTASSDRLDRQTIAQVSTKRSIAKTCKAKHQHCPRRRFWYPPSQIELKCRPTGRRGERVKFCGVRNRDPRAVRVGPVRREA